jgi:hypothetical protein
MAFCVMRAVHDSIEVKEMGLPAVKRGGPETMRYG